MFELHTLRLRLIPLDLTALRVLEQGRAGLAEYLALSTADLAAPEEFRAELGTALAFWLEKVGQHPEQYHWFTDWEIVLKDANRTIGGFGFAGPPNERGEVFTGYWIDPRFQRQGYMTECIGGAVGWAFTQPGVKFVTANTPADNIASQHVLIKNGFQRRGEFEGHPFWVLEKPPL